MSKTLVIGTPNGIGKSAIIGTPFPTSNPFTVQDVRIPTSEILDAWATYLQGCVDFRIDESLIKSAYYMDCGWLIGVRLDPREEYEHYFANFEGFDTLRREALLSACSTIKCGLRMPMYGDSQEFKDLHQERMKPYTLKPVVNFGKQYTNGFDTMPVHIGTEIALISNMFRSRRRAVYEYTKVYNDRWYAFDSRKLPNFVTKTNDEEQTNRLINRGIFEIRAYLKLRNTDFESIEKFVATYCD